MEANLKKPKFLYAVVTVFYQVVRWFRRKKNWLGYVKPVTGAIFAEMLQRCLMMDKPALATHFAMKFFYFVRKSYF